MELPEQLNHEAATALAHDACLGAGASEAAARSLAQATVSAEIHGKPSVGFRHLVDYLSGFQEGRIFGLAAPEISSPAPGLIRCDAKGGIAQLGFDLVIEDLQSRANQLGVTIFAQSASYTTGELGYYVRRLAEGGLVAIAATNGPALVAAPGAKRPVYCTNPIAFAAPVAGRPPLVIDQATSATAFVNIRERAARGEAIPLGWATDASGAETTDARAAMAGALLTVGGARGANIALMVEVLAAGLTGAHWSLDAPSFTSGAQSPGAGLFVVAIAPRLLESDFCERLAMQASRLIELGVYVPGLGGAGAARSDAKISLPASLVRQIEAYRRSASSTPA
jgi:(2R)-3-sulfolactate dehydrogenase (NADP+)